MVEIIVAIITFCGVATSTLANVLINKNNVKKKDLIQQINKVELNNCKNYLVQTIAKCKD